MFDSSWHVRHGAAVGLREIIKHHGNTAGICTWLKPEYVLIQRNRERDRFIKTDTERDIQKRKDIEKREDKQRC